MPFFIVHSDPLFVWVYGPGYGPFETREVAQEAFDEWRRSGSGSFSFPGFETHEVAEEVALRENTWWANLREGPEWEPVRQAIEHQGQPLPPELKPYQIIEATSATDAVRQARQAGEISKTPKVD